MVHVARRLIGALVVLAIVAGVTLALNSRPRLDHDRQAIERAWRSVAPGLDTRYRRADALASAITATGGPTYPLVTEVHQAYNRWKDLTSKTPVATAISTANTLEGDTRRLSATVHGSKILGGDHDVAAALAAMQAVDNPTGVTALDDAVAKYDKDRGGPLRRLIAGPLGFDPVPRLVLANGS